MDYYNATAIIGRNGGVKERYTYSAFGVRRVMAPDFTQREKSHFSWEFGYKGQFLDPETGYYDYGFRYYSPELGRWINRDPIEEQGGRNLYAFVGNRGTGRGDLFGLRGTYTGTEYLTLNELHIQHNASGITHWEDPTPVGITEFETKSEGGQCCKKIRKAPEFRYNYKVILPTDWGTPITVFAGRGQVAWYALTRQGYEAIVAHEFRRRQVIRNADTAFFSPSEGTGARATQCGWICRDSYDAAEAVLDQYISSLQSEALDQWQDYVDREQAGIDSENDAQDVRAREWTFTNQYTGETVTDNVWLFFGHSHIHEIQNASPNWNTRCPQ